VATRSSPDKLLVGALDKMLFQAWPAVSSHLARALNHLLSLQPTHTEGNSAFRTGERGVLHNMLDNHQMSMLLINRIPGTLP